jgi:DNA (cytosine-5)-methyltransferase 1
MTRVSFQAVEICAGAGGQALGLSQAGFGHAALVEIDKHACETLRHNAARGKWKPKSVHEADVRIWIEEVRRGMHNLGEVTLLAGGVPCPPFSIAGKQLGSDDERDLFPAMLELARLLEPRAVMIENVRGLMGAKFQAYRDEISAELEEMEYVPHWQVLEAHHYGVPQLRPRTIMIALRADDALHWSWPKPKPSSTRTVGQTLYASMASKGWEGAAAWAETANAIAPTLVGGSKKHGGADLGPTRAKRQWAGLGVDGLGVANDVPGPGSAGSPKLTVQQAAMIQGFPATWEIQGRKTAAYRQVGNAFPPPVAKAVGMRIRAALEAADSASVALDGVAV